MHWLIPFKFLIISAAMFLSSTASIKQEIPDLNIAIGIENDIQSPHGFRIKTIKDKKLQALLKIQKKLRTTTPAGQNVRPITEKEKKFQKLIKIQKYIHNQPKVSPSNPQQRVRAKTKPQYPTYS
jgi:acyl-[acyl carrier protein]--UDP-N-acetylglucosamine O-acyltransferase